MLLFLSFIFILFAGENEWTCCFDSCQIASIAVDPVNPERVYAVGLKSDEVGAYRSMDGGETWENMDNGLSLEVGVSMSGIAIDPINTNNLYLSLGIFAENLLYKSTDYGDSWFPSDSGLQTIGSSIVVNPLNPEILYHCQLYIGMAKSYDAGANWVDSGNGIVEYYTAILRINPINPEILYVTTTDIEPCSSVVYKTEDGANLWELKMNGLYGIGTLFGLVIDPLYPDTVYVGASGISQIRRSSVFKTVDGGESWIEAGNGLPTEPSGRTTLSIDPLCHNRIYAGFTDNGYNVYRTLDGGENWSDFSTGLTENLEINHLEVAPTNPRKIFLGSRYRGIWSYTDTDTNIVDESGQITVKENCLYQNYPNPFNNSTMISFNINSDNGEVAEIGIYNIKGEKIKEYSIDDGRFSIEWNGSDESNKPVSPGIYLYKLKTGKEELFRKCILID